MRRAATRALLALLAASPDPTAVRRVVDPEVVAAAERLGILPVLAGIAVRRGVIPDAADSVAAILGHRRHNLSPAAALLAARHENRRRHRDLRELERRTDEALARYRTVALKGAALRRHRIWPDPDDRPQRDVDLWCPETSVAALAQVELRRTGFRPATEQPALEAWSDDHHDDPLVVAGLTGSVEMHRHPTIGRARSALTYRLRQTPAGVELTPESMVAHIIVHAQLQDFSHALRRLPLVALLDVAYALESGFVTEEGLRAAAESRAAVKAVDFHLYCVARLRGRRPVAALSLRIRWWCAVLFLDLPRLAALQRELVQAPHALSREMMQLRAGRALGPVALQWHRARFALNRGARTVSRVTSER